MAKTVVTMSLPPWMRYALYGNAAIDVVVFLVPKNISLMVDEKFQSCQGPPREMKDLKRSTNPPKTGSKEARSTSAPLAAFKRYSTVPFASVAATSRLPR